MKLYQKELSSNSILNSTYLDDSGRVIYKVHTPNPNSLMGPGTTTVSKVVYSTKQDSCDTSPSFPVSHSKDGVAQRYRYPGALDKDSACDERRDETNTGGKGELPGRPLSSSPSLGLQMQHSKDSDSRVSTGDSQLLAGNANPNEHLSLQTPNQETEKRRYDGRDLPLEHITQFDWKVFKSSRLRFGDGREVLSRDFFRKESWGLNGR
ncbi:hypothetical protein K435DRAFT_869167 [Dendrothele bispora CBS 962.96]|uniref:Uncharacterized protein n=1 Tax=Dendrothele bispora (strain CBS 962.96) TaxID=1314807 RepID=A0A4S8L9U2_DENBC|nr:hypothetical protein K435DRAFT_869167 [Dendrothele bispora CBS 962.96]